MSPREALDRIAALCNEQRSFNPHLTATVRAILADVSPETGGVLDRDQARGSFDRERFVLGLESMPEMADSEAVADLAEECIRPDDVMQEQVDALYRRLRLAEAVQPATIDRDALLDIVLDEDLADAILALVRPASGVTLTPEEAALAAEALHIGQETLDDYADQFSDVDARLDEGKTRTAAAGMRALAARLEAAQ